MSEAEDVEKPSVDHAEANGWMCRKLDVGPGSKGWLDQLFLGPNNCHFIVEFKDTDCGVVSPKQHKKIKKLRDMGHTVYICDRLSNFIPILKAENYKAANKYYK